MLENNNISADFDHKAGPAILFIHGIQEGPAIFNRFDSLVPEDWKTVKLLLDGHQAPLSEFNKAGMKTWHNQVENALKNLHKEGYFPVYLVGHSMGTLLALKASLNFEIAGLFLIDTPLSLHPRINFILQQFFPSFRKPEDPYFQSAIESWTTIRENFWQIFGMIPNYLQLLFLILKTRKNIIKIRCPVFCILSERDELLSLHSLKWISQNPDFSWRILKDSGHFYKPEADFNRMASDFSGFIFKEDIKWLGSEKNKRKN